MNRSAGTLCYSDTSTGMAGAVLHEILRCLDDLVMAEKTTSIDLRSLPLTDADLAELEEFLGRGEVEAEVNVIGPSTVRETAFAGVWWIRHLGGNGQTAAEEIAITKLPEILEAHTEDIQVASDRLRKSLDTLGTATIHSSKETSNG